MVGGRTMRAAGDQPRPKKHCFRCGRELEFFGLGHRSGLRATQEVWLCPDGHETWTWLLAEHRWRREIEFATPAAARPVGDGDTREVTAAACAKCRRRMVLHEHRDYGSAADVVARIIRIRKWVCECGYEDEVCRTIEA